MQSFRLDRIVLDRLHDVKRTVPGKAIRHEGTFMSMPPPADQPSPLSVSRAFVVQFQAGTDLALGRCAGRVEHVASGQTAVFNTLGELLAFISRVLPQASGHTP